MRKYATMPLIQNCMHFVCTDDLIYYSKCSFAKVLETFAINTTAGKPSYYGVK